MWSPPEMVGDFADDPNGYGGPSYNSKRAAEPPATQELSRRDWRKEGKRPAQLKPHPQTLRRSPQINLPTSASGRSCSTR